MTKPKNKIAKKKSAKSAGKRRGRPSVDLEGVRHQIHQRIGQEALGMVESTIAEADKGHYPAMKYLFEIIGLYPTTGEEAEAGDDSLARTLMRRLVFPDEPASEASSPKDLADVAPAVTGDTVK
jgi:hypothetical protein